MALLGSNDSVRSGNSLTQTVPVLKTIRIERRSERIRPEGFARKEGLT